MKFMFESLSDRLQNVMHKIKGYGKIPSLTLLSQKSSPSIVITCFFIKINLAYLSYL